MSKYTTEVRFICETAAGLVESVGYSQVSEVIQSAVPVIFDFDFPIWDEEYRSVLCSKILKHYYTREIGFESVGLWKLKLDTKLNEIMPYYNERYKTVDMKFNPLNDVDYTRTSSGDESGTNKRETNESELNERNRQGNITKQDSGSDMLSKGGTIDLDKSGTVDVSNSGNEINAANGENTDRKTGTVGVVGNGTNTQTDTDKFSDTPQGGLQGVNDGTYLTTADVKNRNGTTSNSETTTYNTTDTSNGNSESERSFDSDEKTTHNTKDRTSYDTTDTTTYGRKNVEENSGNESERNNRLGNENGEFSTTKDYVEHVVGKMGNRTYASVIKEYRDALINIDMEVIDELKDLFMLLW